MTESDDNKKNAVIESIRTNIKLIGLVVVLIVFSLLLTVTKFMYHRRRVRRCPRTGRAPSRTSADAKASRRLIGR